MRAGMLNIDFEIFEIPVKRHYCCDVVVKYKHIWTGKEWQFWY